MSMDFDVSNELERPVTGAAENAHQTLMQDLPFYPESPDTPQSPQDLPQAPREVSETPQDRRTFDLVQSLTKPIDDWGKLTEKLRYTFVDELNENGISGMRQLADRVAQGSGYYLSIDPFRGSQRVYALTIYNTFGRAAEIPITGRGSSQDRPNPNPPPSPYDNPSNPYSDTYPDSIPKPDLNPFPNPEPSTFPEPEGNIPPSPETHSIPFPFPGMNTTPSPETNSFPSPETNTAPGLDTNSYPFPSPETSLPPFPMPEPHTTNPYPTPSS